MKKISLALVVLLVLIGLFYWYSDNSSVETPQENADLARYENTELNYSFNYPGGTEGYLVQPIPITNESYPGLEEGLIIILQEDYQSILRGEREGGEGPPSINVFVFTNSGELSLEDWLNENAQITNSNLIMGEYSQTTLGGAPALSYEADGLYASRNIVTQIGDYLYYISGSYIDRNSLIYRDFSTITETFEFLP